MADNRYSPPTPIDEVRAELAAVRADVVHLEDTVQLLMRDNNALHAALRERVAAAAAVAAAGRRSERLERSERSEREEGESVSSKIVSRKSRSRSRSRSRSNDRPPRRAARRASPERCVHVKNLRVLQRDGDVGTEIQGRLTDCLSQYGTIDSIWVGGDKSWANVTFTDKEDAIVCIDQNAKTPTNIHCYPHRETNRRGK